jgi:hypothetical protein
VRNAKTDPNLKSASETTLQRLQRARDGLKVTLATQEEALKQIKTSDRIVAIDEMKVMIPLLYAETERLKQSAKKAKEVESVMESELARVKGHILSARSNEKSIDTSQIEIDKFTEKLFAYKKDEIRQNLVENLRDLLEHPPLKIDAIRKKLEEEIEAKRTRCDEMRKEIDDIQQNEMERVCKLNDTLRNQIEAVRTEVDRRIAEKEEEERNRATSEIAEYAKDDEKWDERSRASGMSATKNDESDSIGDAEEEGTPEEQIAEEERVIEGNADDAAGEEQGAVQDVEKEEERED